MGDQRHSTSPDFHRILGITKAASIRDFCKAYKSRITKWHPDKKARAQAKLEAYEAINNKKQDEKNIYGVQESKNNRRKGLRGDDPSSPKASYKHRSVDYHFPSNYPSFLSKSTSQRSYNSTSTTPNFFPKSMSTRSTNPTSVPPSLSKSTSQRSTTTNPIMFSYSKKLEKPPPVEKQLECTLEELCYGCVKKIVITSDVVTDTGTIVQEEELLRISVKPGWKKGTKITFEGMGDKKPGTLPADIIFLITERRHPLFKREENDLALEIEIPLVKALTGSTLSIPLLGGEKKRLSLNEIIYPGYEKLIAGQGMPNPKEQGRRGDMRIKFRVDFPTELSDEQRSDLFSLLQDSS